MGEYGQCGLCRARIDFRVVHPMAMARPRSNYCVQAVLQMYLLVLVRHYYSLSLCGTSHYHENTVL
jgi:hypothetical protein